MPIKVKDPNASQAKYVANAGNAVPAYKAGVSSPKASQSAMAVAAIPRWQQAVSSSAAANAMKSGLTKAGDQGWMNGALNKGANNYPAGITRGKDKWLANVTPYFQAIAAVNLPDKGLRGSSANIQRVAAVAAALHTLKVQTHGGS
jgi:hypothetical protein